jgi:L,D-transpeptidase catalytic domain/Putative peptidoglycan binding domain/Bacterial Ig domain
MGGWLHSAGAKAAAAAAAVVATGAAGYAAYGYSTTASLGAVWPRAGASVRSATPDIAIHVSNADNLGRYTLRIDGRDLTTASSMAGGAIRLVGVHLPDGRHTVTVTATGDGVFGGSVDRSWAFAVDTHAPPLRLGGLPSGWLREHTLALSGHTQPGARVTAAADVATAHVTAGADGSFALSLAVSDGTIPLVVTATDAAGNRRSVDADVKVDDTPPAVTFGLGDVVASSRPRLEVNVSDTAPTRETVRLDGARTRPGSRPQVPLSQGRHTLAVTARDRAGNRTEERLHFVVDSTEHLGDATLRRGAIGRDVKDLQKLLRRQGFLHGPPTGVYASGTVAAVKAFQKASDLPVDGAVGIYTLGALSGRIVIDQSAHLLTLERFGRPPISFPVALGQPAYPTPDGHFTIISKVENPTWVPPPDAPWAQGAVPIPPGPGNPLGTRWMGLSTPGVGIHGTDDPASIGYSVSHGCIRMQVPDAERLFTMVSLGMGVYIHA